MNLRLTYSARLASQHVPVICLSPPLQYWHYRHVPLPLACYMGARDPNLSFYSNF